MPLAAVSGDVAHAFIRTKTISGAEDLEFISASFTAASEERRVLKVFFNIPTAPAKQFELKVIIQDVRFAEFDLLGHPQKPGVEEGGMPWL